MEKHQVSKAQLFAIAGTRVALGVGLGLLLSDRVSAEHKRRVGIALLTVGIASTVPIAFNVLSDRSRVIDELAA